MVSVSVPAGVLTVAMRTPGLPPMLLPVLALVAMTPPGSGERDGSFAGMDTAATTTATGGAGHGTLAAVELKDVRLLKDGGDGDWSFFKSAESLNTECERSHPPRSALCLRAHFSLHCVRMCAPPPFSPSLLQSRHHRLRIMSPRIPWSASSSGSSVVVVGALASPSSLASRPAMPSSSPS